MKTVHFIVHHKAVTHSLFVKVKAAISHSPNLSVVYKFTERSKHATELAASSCQEGADFIIAVGGDGTAHEVVNGIAGTEVAFGIVPCGTGNDFCRSLGSFDVKRFVSAIVESDTTLIDLGKIHFENGSVYFLNIADIGFGAEVVNCMNLQREKGITGKLSYSLAILRTFFTYRKTRIVIDGGTFEFEGEVLLIAFCNGKSFGHGLTIHPDASIQDGELAVTKIGNVNVFEYLMNLPKLKRGRKIKHQEVSYWKTTSVKIISNSSLHIEADGELYMKSVQSVEIVPKKLRLLNASF